MPLLARAPAANLRQLSRIPTGWGREKKKEKAAHERQKEAAVCAVAREGRKKKQRWK
jgi:hypothetical protein